MALILYEEDWDRYPTAFPDFDTKNENALRFCSLLKEMGIQNNRWPLALHDERLIGVDPFDPNISRDMALLVSNEASINFWYFIRECSRTPNSTPTKPAIFNMNRANMATYWLYFNHVFNLLVQPRQTGKSYGIDTLAVWLLELRLRKSFINLLTKDDQLRAKNLERLKKIDSELPFYLKTRGDRDIANTEQIKISLLDNTYTGFVPQKSAKAAQMVGRGHTSENNFIDEPCYIPNVGISVPAMLAAGNMVRTIAKENGTPYGTIMSTTVGDLAEDEGLYVYRMAQNSAPFSETMYDCRNEQDLRKVVKTNSRTNEKNVPYRVYTEFNHRQLGISDEQIQEWMADAAAEGADAEKDFLNKWKFGEANTALEKSDRQVVENSQQDPLKVEIMEPYGYMMRWYVEPSMMNTTFSNDIIVLGLDTSDASGGDSIGLVGTHSNSGEVLLDMDINETTIASYIQFLFDFMMRYPNTILIGERRSTGPTILESLITMFLMKNLNPFKRIFNFVANDHKEKESLYKLINRDTVSDEVAYGSKKTFGFATSAMGVTSRSELFSTTMREALRHGARTMRSKKLCSQIMALIRDKNGKVNHRSGAHDDLVIAWLLTYWFLTAARNTQFYGLHHSSILKSSAASIIDNDPMTLMKKRIEDAAVMKFELLATMLRTERDKYVRSRLELQIKQAFAALPASSKKARSYDEMLDQLYDSMRMSR